MNKILSINNLSKSYGAVTAVDNVSFSVREGICFGLLGPNGAGKTTTIEMMETILTPDSGEILFRGQPCEHHYKEKIGIQFQHTALQEFITVRETLKLFASLYPSPRSMDEVIELCSLTDIIDRDNRKLSGGQRQRMLLALAIINDPEIVFLDEPTTGLDPQARRNFWNLIQKIKGENKTIILTTHYMDEAETLCEEIAIMDHGRIIAQDSPAALLTEHFHGVIIQFPYSGDLSRLPDGAHPAEGKEGVVEIHTPAMEETISLLLRERIDLTGLNIHSPDLEDLFLHLTGSHLRA